jgi:protein farnesyltransferase subunit beta
MADAYHSCYVLAGLSSAQHDWDLEEPTAAEEISVTAEPVWTVLPHLEQIFDRRDLVRPIHPVYAIPQQNARAIKDYFRAKQGF